MSPTTDHRAGAGTRRRVVAGLVTVALVAAAIVTAVVLLGPDRGEQGAADDATTRLPDVLAVVDAQDQQGGGNGSSTPASLPLVTYEVFLSRDPFQPVVPSEIPDESDQDEQNGTTNNSSNNQGGNGTTNDDDNDDNDETTPSGTAGRQRVTLVDISTQGGEQIAVVQIDTTIYEVPRGQVFASNYEVRAFLGDCVNLRRGDVAFRVCTGDVVLK